jgi:hypothetical protein
MFFEPHSYRAPGKANMAFCAICGRNHDLGVGCLDGTQDLLKSAGTTPPPELSKEGFKRISKQADRWFLKVLVWAFLAIVILFLIASFVKKTY